MKDWLLLAAVYGLLYVATADAAETSPCRSYLPAPGEQCMYPTQRRHFRDVIVCACPGAEPCEARP